MKIDSKRVMEYGPGLLPLRVIDAPDNLDFSEGKELGKALADPILRKSYAGGVDHYFELSHQDEDFLILKKNGIIMKVKTDFPGLQIYGNNYPSGFKMQGDQGIDSLFGALAIEPMGDILSVLYQPSEEDSFKEGYIEYGFYRG